MKFRTFLITTAISCALGAAAPAFAQTAQQDLQQYVNSHPELQANPSLMNNPTYRANHPDLNHFLETHPQVDRQRLREQLGLTRPILVQFGTYIADGLRGDLGESFRFRQPTARLVGDRRRPLPTRVGTSGSLSGPLLARHVELELRLGVADQLAAEVDGHRVQRSAEAERGVVVVADR